ncbi:MAG: hypothetical protein HZB38_02225 [Planctomycetes bacterium]|nr:hypothetical protein [Planctomycetota bacterium]
MIKLNLKPSPADLRQFGFLACGVFGVLGLLLILHWIPVWRLLGSATTPVAYGLWVVGALSAVLSLVAPRATWPLYAGLSIVGYPIGMVLSYVVLAALFYLVFTPLGLLFRLFGRDPLHRRFEPEAETYWVACKTAKKPQDYFSQH